MNELFPRMRSIYRVRDVGIYLIAHVTAKICSELVSQHSPYTLHLSSSYEVIDYLLDVPSLLMRSLNDALSEGKESKST
jgi:hypothetical protein